MMYKLSHELGSLQWDIEASQISYKIKKSSKPLLKIYNHLQKFSGKF